MPAPLPRTLLPVRDPYESLGPRPQTPADVELLRRATDAALGRLDDPAAGPAWERRRRELLEEARRAR